MINVDKGWTVYDNLIGKASQFLENQRGLFALAIILTNLTFFGGFCAFALGKAQSAMSVIAIASSVYNILVIILIFLVTMRKPHNFNGPGDFRPKRGFDKEMLAEYIELIIKIRQSEIDDTQAYFFILKLTNVGPSHTYYEYVLLNKARINYEQWEKNNLKSTEKVLGPMPGLVSLPGAGSSCLALSENDEVMDMELTPTLEERAEEEYFRVFMEKIRLGEIRLRKMIKDLNKKKKYTNFQSIENKLKSVDEDVQPWKFGQRPDWQQQAVPNLDPHSFADKLIQRALESIENAQTDAEVLREIAMQIEKLPTQLKGVQVDVL